MKYLENIFISTGVLVWGLILTFLLLFVIDKTISFLRKTYPFTLLNLIKLKFKYKNNERMVKYYALKKWITKKDLIRLNDIRKQGKE